MNRAGGPRKQWVFLHQCGCAFGVLEHADHTQAEAWQDFYDEGTKARTEKKIGAAVAGGVTVTLVDHSRYVAEFLPHMFSTWQCPHLTAPGAADMSASGGR